MVKRGIGTWRREPKKMRIKALRPIFQ